MFTKYYSPHPSPVPDSAHVAKIEKTCILWVNLMHMIKVVLSKKKKKNLL